MARGARARFRLYSLLGCLLALGHVRTLPLVRAEEPTTAAREPPEYRQLIGRAVREFDAGNFPEARGLFSRAHDVYPNARTYLGLGFTAFELRNYGISVDNLERALASKTKPLDTKLRKSAEDVLGRARENLAQVNLSIAPRTGRVLVDGVPTQVEDDKALLLEVGDHSIEVQASGYLGERRTLRIVGGEQLNVRVVLQKPEATPGPNAQPSASDASADAPVADHAASERSPLYKSPWLWVGVGVVLVAGGVTTFLLLRESEKSEPRAPTLTDNTPTGGALQALRSW